MSEWWVNFFDDVYGDLILHTFDAKEIKESVTFIVNEFSINKETRIYDQCCGKGSMSLPLLEKTPHIYGCDIIPSYIKAIQSQTSKGKFIAADAREYRPDEDMDIIIIRIQLRLFFSSDFSIVNKVRTFLYNFLELHYIFMVDLV